MLYYLYRHQYYRLGIMSSINRPLYSLRENGARTMAFGANYRRFISLSRRCSVLNPAVKLMISSCRSCDRLAQRTSRDSRRDNRTPDVEPSANLSALTTEVWNANYYNRVCGIQGEVSRVIVRNIASYVKRVLETIRQVHYFIEKNRYATATRYSLLKFEISKVPKLFCTHTRTRSRVTRPLKN